MILITGCKLEENEELKKSVYALSTIADECVLDVRDREMKYDKSNNCQKLWTLVDDYMKKWGGLEDTPKEIEIIFERVRVSAWMAKALSAGSDSSIW